MLQVSRTLADKVNEDESLEPHMRQLDASTCWITCVVAASRRRCVKFTYRKVRVAAASNQPLKTGLFAGVCGPLLVLITASVRSGGKRTGAGALEHG
jgi:hypothetical protein